MVTGQNQRQGTSSAKSQSTGQRGKEQLPEPSTGKKGQPFQHHPSRVPQLPTWQLALETGT